MSDHPTSASSAAEKPEQVTKPEMSMRAIIAQSLAASDEKRRQRQAARRSKTGGKKRSLPQAEEEESGAAGERSSAASSKVVKRPRVEALNMSGVHKHDLDGVDLAARGGFISSVGSSSTAEDFAAAMNGIIEDNLRKNNGSFQDVSWSVKSLTKKDRELAHRVYQRRRIPLEHQYELELERRGGIEQSAGNTARLAASGATAASAAIPTGTEGGEQPVVYKTGIDCEEMSRDDLDAEMEQWRWENNMDVDK